MVLIRPVTKTKISTADFGHPVYDWIVANTPTAWTGVPFSNGWQNFGGGYQAAQYRKIGDMVYVRGTITGGAAGTVAFTLPAGFRPLQNMGFPAAAFVGSRVILLVLVTPSGTVTIYDHTGNVDLNTIAFSTI